MKKLLLILLLASISLWSNPNDIQLVPFDKALHDDQLKAIYKDKQIVQCGFGMHSIFYHRVIRNDFSGFRANLLYDESNTTKVCVLNKAIIGFVIYKDSVTKDNIRKRYIYWMGIDTEYQRQANPATNQDGYGTALMKKLEQLSIAQNIEELELYPHPIETVSFYKRLSFIVDDMYAPLMQKTLKKTDHDSKG